MPRSLCEDDGAGFGTEFVLIIVDQRLAFRLTPQAREPTVGPDVGHGGGLLAILKKSLRAFKATNRSHVRPTFKSRSH